MAGASTPTRTGAPRLSERGTKLVAIESRQSNPACRTCHRTAGTIEPHRALHFGRGPTGNAPWQGRSSTSSSRCGHGRSPRRWSPCSSQRPSCTSKPLPHGPRKGVLGTIRLALHHTSTSPQKPSIRIVSPHPRHPGTPTKEAGAESCGCGIRFRVFHFWLIWWIAGESVISQRPIRGTNRRTPPFRQLNPGRVRGAQIRGGAGQVGSGAGAGVGGAAPVCRECQQHLLGLHQRR